MRLWLFAPALVGLTSLFLWGLAGLPPVGNYRGPYGDILNSVATLERHVTDVVSAINFDYRRRHAQRYFCVNLTVGLSTTKLTQQ